PDLGGGVERTCVGLPPPAAAAAAEHRVLLEVLPVVEHRGDRVPVVHLVDAVLPVPAEVRGEGQLQGEDLTLLAQRVQPHRDRGPGLCDVGHSVTVRVWTTSRSAPSGARARSTSRPLPGDRAVVDTLGRSTTWVPSGIVHTQLSTPSTTAVKVASSPTATRVGPSPATAAPAPR